MANFYDNYQIPYDVDQVNLYDHNHYHQPQEQQFGFEPMSYNPYYNWNGSESETTPTTVAYSGYDPVSYNCYNWNGSETETTSASIAYSVSTMSEPKHLFYDPNLYTTYESPPQFRIYCSVASALEFNEPEFDDYDPTPYGGGYDILATYGKPLPPSVETCYPSSTAPHAKAPSPPEIIAPVPLGIYDGGEKNLVKKHDGGEKNLVKKRVSFAEPVEEARPIETIKEEDDEDDEESEEEEDYDDEESEEGEEEEEDHSSRYGNEKEDDSSSYATEKPEIVDKGEVKVLYFPSGYGLEATDLCEVIFGGYFPCVLRNKRRQEDDARAAAVSCWESNDSDPWKTTSDYLFGDSYPYGYDNRSERNQFEISSYGYRRS